MTDKRNRSASVKPKHFGHCFEHLKKKGSCTDAECKKKFTHTEDPKEFQQAKESWAAYEAKRQKAATEKKNKD